MGADMLSHVDRSFRTLFFCCTWIFLQNSWQASRIVALSCCSCQPLSYTADLHYLLAFLCFYLFIYIYFYNFYNFLFLRCGLISVKFMFVFHFYRFLIAGLKVDPCHMLIFTTLLKMLNSLRTIFQGILWLKGLTKPEDGESYFMVFLS